eukprot:8158041-Pyramimonas_sp.AAC.1
MAVAQEVRGQRPSEKLPGAVRNAWPRAVSCDLEAVQTAARASRSKEKSMADRVAAEEGSGKVEAQAGATCGQVVEWLRELEFRTDKDTGRRVVNAKQFEMVKP